MTKTVPATYLNIAPAECRPCRKGDHRLCSWDGEPDCLCATCTDEHKQNNRDALEAQMSGDYEPPTPEEREELDRLGSSNV